jgi:peptidoglycan/xylan/chitin deacetylase (PgdA/CDA1 family)
VLSTLRRQVLNRAGPGPLRWSRSSRCTPSSRVLTFDDGPEPGGAEKVLAALSDYAQTATFFVLVYRALRYPELLAEVVAARR